MLTRTTTRRSAVVLAMALMAMFLVVLAGSARAAQNRVGASNVQATPAPVQGRQASAVPPAAPDQALWHLDFVSTPPTAVDTIAVIGAEHVTADASSIVATDAITAVGRAPPAL